MQGIILCAGMGKRILQSIDNKPKCLLKISNKSIIEHQIDLLNKYINKPPLLVVGYKEDMIRELLNGRGIGFVRNPEYASTNILMSLWYAFNSRKINDGIICLPGDLMFDDNVIKRLLEADSEITIAVANRPCDDEAVKVLVEDKCVISIGKHLKTEDASWEFLGMFKASKQFTEVVKKQVDELIASGSKGAYMFTVIQHLADKGIKVGYVDISGSLWEEIDFFDDYLRAKEKFSATGGSASGRKDLDGETN